MHNGRYSQLYLEYMEMWYDMRCNMGYSLKDPKRETMRLWVAPFSDKPTWSETWNLNKPVWSLADGKFNPIHPKSVVVGKFNPIHPKSVVVNSYPEQFSLATVFPLGNIAKSHCPDGENLYHPYQIIVRCTCIVYIYKLCIFIKKYPHIFSCFKDVGEKISPKTL